MEFTLYMTVQKNLSRDVDERAEDIKTSKTESKSQSKMMPDKGRENNFGQNNAEDVDTEAKATKDSKSKISQENALNLETLCLRNLKMGW